MRRVLANAESFLSIGYFFSCHWTDALAVLGKKCAHTSDSQCQANKNSIMLQQTRDVARNRATKRSAADTQTSAGRGCQRRQRRQQHWLMNIGNSFTFAICAN